MIRPELKNKNVCPLQCCAEPMDGAGVTHFITVKKCGTIVQITMLYHSNIVQQFIVQKFLCVCEGDDPPNLCCLLICCVRSHRGASEQVGTELWPLQRVWVHLSMHIVVKENLDAAKYLKIVSYALLIT